MCVCVGGGAGGAGENGTVDRKPDFATTVSGIDPFRLSGHPWDSGTQPGKRSGEKRQTFSLQLG